MTPNLTIVFAILSPSEVAKLEEADFTVEKDSESKDPNQYKIWVNKPAMQLLEDEIKQSVKYFSEPIAEL